MVILVTRRQKGVHLEGLWEFPGGKTDLDETHAAALKREIAEELDADVEDDASGSTETGDEKNDDNGDAV